MAAGRCRLRLCCGPHFNHTVNSKTIVQAHPGFSLVQSSLRPSVIDQSDSPRPGSPLRSLQGNLLSCHFKPNTDTLTDTNSRTILSSEVKMQRFMLECDKEPFSSSDLVLVLTQHAEDIQDVTICDPHIVALSLLGVCFILPVLSW